MASECAAVSRPEAMPDIGRGALVDGSCELVEPELIAAAERGGGLLNAAGAETLASAIALLGHALIPKLPPRAAALCG